MCRSFVSGYLDCGSRMVDKTRDCRGRLYKLEIEVQGCGMWSWRGEMWLKGRGPVDTLCHGEVAERLNAAVSKTVTSVIPASGVRIPPSPQIEAGQHVSTPPCGRLVSQSASRSRISPWLHLTRGLHSRRFDECRKATDHATMLKC